MSVSTTTPFSICGTFPFQDENFQACSLAKGEFKKIRLDEDSFLLCRGKSQRVSSVIKVGSVLRTEESKV